jgi:hypothetical protein
MAGRLRSLILAAVCSAHYALASALNPLPSLKNLIIDTDLFSDVE